MLIAGLSFFSISLILFTGCAANTAKKGLAKANEVNDKLLEAKKESIEKYEAFKDDSAVKVSDVDRTIAKVRADLKDKDDATKAKVETKLKGYEQRTQAVKSKIKNYKIESESNIVSFIVETTQEIDSIRKGVKELVSL